MFYSVVTYEIFNTMAYLNISEGVAKIYIPLMILQGENIKIHFHIDLLDMSV
jgi:hypothetical protein